MLIDSHCHLDDERLSLGLEAVLGRAKENHITGMLSIAARFEEFKSVIKIAEKYENVWASLGIHPAEAGKENPSYETLLPFYGHPKVIGVGEGGFDFYYADKATDFERQRDLFLTQIHLAQDLDKPLVVHTRDAEPETRDILQSEFKNKPFKAIMHCYTGTWDLAKDMLDLGFYVSASGVITFKKADDIRDVFSKVPMDRLLVETDAPYLAPEPYRGKTCEPAYTLETARRLASLKGVSFEDLADQTTFNFKDLFGL
ncbi:MAG: TatD family hydrolase [Alphaproteobacteria bacterium]|nr:TatD family hydrolase [Alphaproteobacteria bacterium]MBN2780183.1 TatD family hydrolase [Alphaproteobacteria bacterium]